MIKVFKEQSLLEKQEVFAPNSRLSNHVIHHTLHRERLMILEKLWEKANVKFFWIEGMQVWNKGKIVGLALPTLKACFT